ncbi:MAG TPA: hypothetical protein PKD53_29710 [Chloroflexaceae bacterium]|nr:hypothetical protein [Chloroflexaceae bacterium]
MIHHLEAPVAGAQRRAHDRLAWLVLPALLLVAALLPIWSVRYIAPHDYYQHLQEAQIVLRYDDPAFDYRSSYLIREGWHLRSNTLSTLAMIWLGHLAPIEVAGKLALSIYVVLLVGGVTALLRSLGRPAWLLLLLPPLIYSSPFTSGWLNWSYGLALCPLAILCYLRWQRAGSPWALALLAGLGVLIYMAHGFAWGMALIILCTLAVVDGLPLRRYLMLGLALQGAVPMLLAARPLLALAPAAVWGGAWLAATVVRRLRLRPRTWVALGVAGAGLYLVAAALFYNLPAIEGLRNAVIPHVGILPRPRLTAPILLLTLPQFEVPTSWPLVAANLTLLALLGLAALLLLAGTVAHHRAHGVADWRWLTVAGVLALGYVALPSYTPDIEQIELRVLMLFCLTALCWVRLPPPGGWARRALAGVLVALALFSTVASLAYFARYDALARGWDAALGQLSPRSRIAVIGHSALPIPSGGIYRLKQINRILNQSQFVTLHSIRHGGFATNSLWNGPLAPRDPTLLRSHWYDRDAPAESVAASCGSLRRDYTYLITWDIVNRELLDAVEGCYGPPLIEQGRFTVWAP